MRHRGFSILSDIHCTFPCPFCNTLINARLTVCAPFCPYYSKTITLIKLKFGGQVESSQERIFLTDPLYHM